MTHRPQSIAVIEPDARRSAAANLPPATTKRWVVRRKAQVVAAVRDGVLSLEEACSRYKLTVDEFLTWQTTIERHGVAGLRTTRLQHYRIWSSAGAMRNQPLVGRSIDGR
jgi:hypothetical protein